MPQHYVILETYYVIVMDFILPSIDSMHGSVAVPPYIDTTDLDLYPKVIKGKVALLQCPVQGIPFPNITWYKERKVVVEGPRTRVLSSGRQLELSMTEEKDGGKYTCEAVNTAGRASQAFNLSVLGWSPSQSFT